MNSNVEIMVKTRNTLAQGGKFEMGLFLLVLVIQTMSWGRSRGETCKPIDLERLGF